MITDIVPRSTQNCNGSLKTFSFTFPLIISSNLTVRLINTVTGVITTLTETTDYTVADPDGVTGVLANYATGGSITTTPTDAWSSDYQINLERTVPYTQEQHYTEGMATLYATFERGLDKLTMELQQIKDITGRSPFCPATDSTSLDMEMPTADARAGKLLGFDDDGEPVAVTEIEGVSVSSFGNALLISADADEARTALEVYSKTETDTAIDAAIAGAASKWTQLVKDTDFNDQAASTSTITMVTDQTASIKAGMAVKFKLSGTYYYAICTAMAAGLLTIAGAPLTTGDGDLTEVWYSTLPGQVIQVPILVPGYFADATESSLLLNDNLEYLKWTQTKAYLVRMSATQKVADTGSENTVNCAINGSNVFSTALTLDATAGTWANTVVAVTTANYDINFDESIELVATKVGNGDCTDLSVVLTFVGE